MQSFGFFLPSDLDSRSQPLHVPQWREQTHLGRKVEGVLSIHIREVQSKSKPERDSSTNDWIAPEMGGCCTLIPSLA